jgi:hypothetical protein
MGKDLYQTPEFERYFPGFAWGVLLLMILGVIIPARYDLWRGQLESLPFEQALWFAGLALLIALIVWARYWAIDAPYRVFSVQWDNEEVVLATQRGDKVQLPWSAVISAQLPSYSGPENASAAHYNRARLSVLERDRPYIIPLSYNESCRHFLDALKEKVTVSVKQ